MNAICAIIIKFTFTTMLLIRNCATLRTMFIVATIINFTFTTMLFTSKIIYFMPNDEIWMTTYNELILFFNTYCKRPVNKSNELVEKRICINESQLKNYKNNEHSMKDIDKRQLWENLISSHKQYFRIIINV